MSKGYSLFPILNTTIFEKIGYFAIKDYSFYYTKLNQKIPLICTPSEQGNIYAVNDENGEWNTNDFVLNIKRKLRISNPSFLFGDKGVTSADSELGLALMWLSKKSNQRGVHKVGTISSSQGVKDYDIDITFSSGVLKNELILKTVVYLEKPNNLEKTFFAKKPGTLLGTVDEAVVQFEGNGSIFPIVEVENKQEPLWYVVCDWEDVCVDKFEEENVRLCINRANKNYKQLKSTTGDFNTLLFAEIMASAIQTIIQKTRDDQSVELDAIFESKEYEFGSIAHTLDYFKSTFEWDITSSPEELAKTIRKKFETGFMV